MFEKFVNQYYDLSEAQLLGVAVAIREHPENVTDLKVKREALEKILDICYATRQRVYAYYYQRERCLSIRDMSNLRLAYLILREAKNTSMPESRVINWKCAIRRYTKSRDREGRIVKDNGIDGYIALVEIGPTPIYDRDLADAVFHKYHYIEPCNSAYDCTGRPFTSWYRLVERHGAWYAYHAVAFDV